MRFAFSLVLFDLFLLAMVYAFMLVVAGVTHTAGHYNSQPLTFFARFFYHEVHFPIPNHITLFSILFVLLISDINDPLDILFSRILLAAMGILLLLYTCLWITDFRFITGKSLRDGYPFIHANITAFLLAQMLVLLFSIRYRKWTGLCAFLFLPLGFIYFLIFCRPPEVFTNAGALLPSIYPSPSQGLRLVGVITIDAIIIFIVYFLFRIPVGMRTVGLLIGMAECLSFFFALWGFHSVFACLCLTLDPDFERVRDIILSSFNGIGIIMEMILGYLLFEKYKEK